MGLGRPEQSQEEEVAGDRWRDHGGEAAPDLGSGGAREVSRFTGEGGSGVQQRERRTRKEAKARVRGRVITHKYRGSQ